MDRYALLLSDEGPNIETLQARESESLLDFCYRNIGCSCIEIVNPKGLESPYCLVIDEEGLYVNKPKLNVIASTWYGTAEHNQPIVGKVIVMKHVMTNKGPDIGFLTESEAANLAGKPILIPIVLMLARLNN